MMINKYRAWVKSEKRYIVDTQDFIPLIVTNKGVMKLQPQFEKNYYEILPLDWFIIEQFTGLHDKNGVEIYEGDVVEIGFEFGFYVFSVSYDLEFCSYFYTNIDCKDDVYAIGEFVDDVEKIKVIGNIHERSEDNDK